MPSTRLLSRRSTVNESNDTDQSDSKDEPNLNYTKEQDVGLLENKEYNNQLLSVNGLTLDPKSRSVNLKSENNINLGMQNQQQMMQLHSPYPQHMNRQINVNQNQHTMMNNPNMQLPNLGTGYPPLGFPSFPPNMNEYSYVPNIRFPSKEGGSMDILNPKVVLGRLGTGNPVPTPSLSSFMSSQTVNFGPTAHYSQYFDPREEPDTEFAFLDYSGGVVYDNGTFSHGGRYLVFWEYKGRIWRKSFTVDMFGPEGAKELAETFWVSKMRAIQLYNKNKQDKLLRNDKKGSAGHKKKKPSSPVPETVLPNLSLDPNLAAQYILQDQNKKDLKEVFQKPKKEPVEEFEFKVREPRIDKTELEGLIWDEENSTWSFEKAENNEITFHKITCQNKLDGFKEIKDLKEEYENKVLKEYESCDLKGIVYDKAKMNWKVSYYVASKGVKKNKTFSVTKLGYNKAKESALAFKQIVDECDGDEPEDNTPEPQPQEELFADPMVEHYHKVLSSIAVKQFKDALS